MKHVTVIGKRWFEKTNGNTYHSVNVYLQGKHIGSEDFAYGYGNQYEQSALEILKDKERKLKDVTVLWHIKEHGYTLVSEVANVAGKSDL